MALFTTDELRVVELISRIDYCNPFLPERVELERLALGTDFEEYPGDLVIRVFGRDDHDSNTDILNLKGGEIVDAARARLLDGTTATERELELYEDLALFVLYHRFHDHFRAAIQRALADDAGGGVDFYDEFEALVADLLKLPGVTLLHDDPASHLFAFCFQMNRAFVNIFNYIVGGSMASARLRGAVWQSIFTHDLHRYRRALFDRMADIPTLITGPSGTGKELVAQAIGRSGYLPFDRKTKTFPHDFLESFHPLNLSALSPTLIESELFGHRKGAFTGALEDRKGWFEVCGPSGAVFLDELGEIDPAIQVKLLRVLQTRTFQRLGEAETRVFAGKIVAATNRDLAAAMREGGFRQDLYYRLCADQIETPSLKDQLDGSGEELAHLVQFIADRVAGVEADSLTSEVMEFIEGRLGFDYDWPGNFRELEQCVRNVLIRKEYRPAYQPDRGGDFLEGARNGALTGDELLRGYCRLMYRKTGSYSEAARRLGLDRRTVKARVEEGEE